MAYVSLKEEKTEHLLKVSMSGKTSVFPITNSKIDANMYLQNADGLIDALEDNSKCLIRNIDKTNLYKINVYYYNGKPQGKIDANKILFSEKATISLKDTGQLVVPFNSEMLKKLFPFSEAVRVLGDKVQFENDSYKEQMGIYSINNPTMNGWIVYPEKNVTPNSNTDEGKLVNILIGYGKGVHLDQKKEKQGKNSKRNHSIYIEKSTGWKNAEEYKGDITTWENCIYTLASNPDADGKCKVYIGEASNPRSTKKTRISLHVIDGKTYIDHTKDEACNHRFTRFRIDKLKDEAGEYLHGMQDAMIGIASLLAKECPNGYTVTNKAQGKSFGVALKDKTLSSI